jgi:hypothetical protein
MWLFLLNWALLAARGGVYHTQPCAMGTYKPTACQQVWWFINVLLEDAPYCPVCSQRRNCKASAAFASQGFIQVHSCIPWSIINGCNDNEAAMMTTAFT